MNITVQLCTSRCKCSQCESLPTDDECVCCQEILKVAAKLHISDEDNTISCITQNLDASTRGY